MNKRSLIGQGELAIIGLGSIGTKHLLLNKRSALMIQRIEIHVLKRTIQRLKSYLEMIDYLYDKVDDMKTIYDYVIISHHHFIIKLLLNAQLSQSFLIENHWLQMYKNQQDSSSSALNHKVFVGCVLDFRELSIF